jgi:catechol 2,3-dioxygenase-like lactoylglutathione lyase family enzyme
MPIVSKHIGLVCSSEENSDKFYQELLGLEKLEPRTAPRELANSIFNVDIELKMLNYTGAGVHFEIFIDGRRTYDNTRIEHVCIEVKDLADFLGRCRSLGIEQFQVPRGDWFLTFVRDADGNLFEIKAAG